MISFYSTGYYIYIQNILDKAWIDIENEMGYSILEYFSHEKVIMELTCYTIIQLFLKWVCYSLHSFCSAWILMSTGAIRFLNSCAQTIGPKHYSSDIFTHIDSVFRVLCRWHEIESIRHGKFRHTSWRRRYTHWQHGCSTTRDTKMIGALKSQRCRHRVSAL